MRSISFYESPCLTFRSKSVQEGKTKNKKLSRVSYRKIIYDRVGRCTEEQGRVDVAPLIGNASGRPYEKKKKEEK